MAVNHTRGNKFEPAYEGPYKVLHRNKGGAYMLQDTDGNTMNRNFTPSELKLISHKPDENNPSFVVEKILDHKGTPGNYKYLVKWKGYTRAESTWENTDQFDDINIITKYWDGLKRTTPTPKEKTTPKEKSTPTTRKEKTRAIPTRTQPQQRQKTLQDEGGVMSYLRH